MAINKKLIHFKTKASYDREKAAGNILDTSIVFVKDAKIIATHGTEYTSDGCINMDNDYRYYSQSVYEDDNGDARHSETPIEEGHSCYLFKLPTGLNDIESYTIYADVIDDVFNSSSSHRIPIVTVDNQGEGFYLLLQNDSYEHDGEKRYSYSDFNVVVSSNDLVYSLVIPYYVDNFAASASIIADISKQETAQQISALDNKYVNVNNSFTQAEVKAICENILK